MVVIIGFKIFRACPGNFLDPRKTARACPGSSGDLPKQRVSEQKGRNYSQFWRYVSALLLASSRLVLSRLVRPSFDYLDYVYIYTTVNIQRGVSKAPHNSASW